MVAIVGLIIRTRTEDSFVFAQRKAEGAILEHPARQVWHDMPLSILRTSLVNAMFGGAFFLKFGFGTSYMKAAGYAGSTPETIGLIAAAFMLVFMLIGSLLADIINRRTILLIAAVVFLVFAIPYFYLINTGSFILATIAEVIGFGFVFRIWLRGDQKNLRPEFSDPLSRLRRQLAGYRISASLRRRSDSYCRRSAIEGLRHS